MKPHFNSIHKHLRKPLLIYYMKHSREECMKHFNLTLSEFKSCLTQAYREGSWKALRKETRTHEPWSIDTWFFILRRCGILERKVIAKLSGRSTSERFHSIKEKMKNSGGGNTKFLNGLPFTWAKQIWPGDLIRPAVIKTQSGPTGVRCKFRFLIIPWIEAERLSAVFHTDETVKRCISGMAQFQRFVHQKRDNLILKQIRKIALEGK